MTAHCTPASEWEVLWCEDCQRPFDAKVTLGKKRTLCDECKKDHRNALLRRQYQRAKHKRQKVAV